MVENKVKERKKGKGRRSREFKQAWQKLPEYPLWDAVYVRLGAGESAFSLAKWWKSKGEMEHLAVKTLAKYLGYYRDNDMPVKDKIDMAPLDTHYINTLVKQYSSEIDIFKEFVVLINLQKTRLGVAMEKEDQKKFPMEMTNKIHDQLQSLLRDLFEFQIKTGRLPQVPQKFDLTHSVNRSGGNDSIEIKNQKEELQSKRRVAELALTLINTASQGNRQKAITI